jgi:hypothetical protein
VLVYTKHVCYTNNTKDIREATVAEQQPSRYETAKEPIEVWLRQDNMKVDCWIVYEDESTDVGLDISSLSMRGAQREITGYLIATGYEPVARWHAEVEDGSETVRQFRPKRPEGPITTMGDLEEWIGTERKKREG